MKNIFLILLVLMLSSCIQYEIEIPFEGDGTQIEIYLIKTEKAENFSPSKEINIEDLEDSPWLSHEKIQFYDWSAHSFYLSGEQSNSTGGNYFVLTADKQPVFTGFFYSMLMSSMPPVPSIISDFGFFTPKDVISLNRFGSEDIDGIFAETSQFRIEMENSGLLKEGIKVDLLELKRKNSSTLKYTFKVSNLDTEKIYILDPNKMGESRFHYYTNGVGLQKDNKHYWAEDFETTASDYIKSSWYYKLSPGKSITRTVTLKGYNSLPTGLVTASFNFPGASIKTSGEWRKYDGRIWLGSFRIKKELTLK
jgi:hypothetical protein